MPIMKLFALTAACLSVVMLSGFWWAAMFGGRFGKYETAHVAFWLMLFVASSMGVLFYL